jgi:hypothetical protein
VILNEILYRVEGIEEDYDAVIFNPIASTILKLLRLKLLQWIQYLHHSTLLSIG